MKKNTRIRWLYGCLIFFNCCTSPTGPAPPAPQQPLVPPKQLARITAGLDSLKKMIRPGDVVTRTGNDFTSQSLRMLNRRDQTFSHCGIVNIEHDSIFIYHALGGEWNPDQKLKRESFSAFTDPADNRAAGLFRFDIPEAMKIKLVAAAQDFYRQGIQFDLAFDLKTDDKMYCAEFVYKSFLRATDSTVKFNHSFIGNFEFIGVDDITMDPHAGKIALFNYGLY